MTSKCLPSTLSCPSTFHSHIIKWDVFPWNGFLCFGLFTRQTCFGNGTALPFRGFPDRTSSHQQEGHIIQNHCSDYLFPSTQWSSRGQIYEPSGGCSSSFPRVDVVTKSQASSAVMMIDQKIKRVNCYHCHKEWAQGCYKRKFKLREWKKNSDCGWVLESSCDRYNHEPFQNQVKQAYIIYITNLQKLVYVIKNLLCYLNSSQTVLLVLLFQLEALTFT